MSWGLPHQEHSQFMIKTVAGSAFGRSELLKPTLRGTEAWSKQFGWRQCCQWCYILSIDLLTSGVITTLQNDMDRMPLVKATHILHEILTCPASVLCAMSPATCCCAWVYLLYEDTSLHNQTVITTCARAVFDVVLTCSPISIPPLPA